MININNHHNFQIKKRLFQALSLIKKIKKIISKSKNNIRIKKLNEHLNYLQTFYDDNKIDCSCKKLSEKKDIQLYRDLTEAEKKVNLIFLKESFNTLESELKNKLEKQTLKDIEEKENFLKKALKTGAFSLILKTDFVNKKAITKIINDITKKSIETGKKTASDELKVTRPQTPGYISSISKFNIESIAENYVNDINNRIRNESSNGVSNGIIPALIVSSILFNSKKIADSLASQVSGTVVGTNINIGRNIVFKNNNKLIGALQRSEILDNRICDFCLSVDGRVVTKDDPFAQIGQIHSNCRGYFVPVLSSQSDIVAQARSLPKSINDRFITENGIPIINKFKPFKVNQQPPILKSSKAYEELKKGKTIGRRTLERKKLVTPSTKIK